jgi:tetrahydromethanopterin S-methyltransferase subunit G
MKTEWPKIPRFSISSEGASHNIDRRLDRVERRLELVEVP